MLVLVEDGWADHVSSKDDESQIRKMLCSLLWFLAATWQKFEDFIAASNCVIPVPFIKALWLCARLPQHHITT